MPGMRLTLGENGPSPQVGENGPSPQVGENGPSPQVGENGSSPQVGENGPSPQVVTTTVKTVLPSTLQSCLASVERIVYRYIMPTQQSECAGSYSDCLRRTAPAICFFVCLFLCRFAERSAFALYATASHRQVCRI